MTHSTETSAAPGEVWRHWPDMAAWPQWNDGIEKMEIDGPFAVGTRAKRLHVTGRGAELAAQAIAVVESADTKFFQFLDIGTGLPSANNTHEVAQATAPESRIVYVDNDPVVLAHARA